MAWNVVCKGLADEKLSIITLEYNELGCHFVLWIGINFSIFKNPNETNRESENDITQAFMPL